MSAAADLPRTDGRGPLRLSGIRKTFGDLVALDDISLEVERGRTTVLLGPSGSGKSTLPRCINLLERSTPAGSTWGRARSTWAAGSPSAPCAPSAPARPWSSAVQPVPAPDGPGNVTLAPVESRGVRRAEAGGSDATLAKVGWPTRSTPTPSGSPAVSAAGGHRAGAGHGTGLPAVRRAHPALDPELAAEVVAVLADLAAEDRTMVVVTHSLAFARQVADRVVFLEEGRILQDGSPAEFFESQDARLRRFRDVIGSV